MKTVTALHHYLPGLIYSLPRIYPLLIKDLFQEIAHKNTVHVYRLISSKRANHNLQFNYKHYDCNEDISDNKTTQRNRAFDFEFCACHMFPTAMVCAHMNLLDYLVLAI